jgi:integrase/recombinase XerD
LRSLGVVDPAISETECSVAAQLTDRFARYLREERSLSEATVMNYCPEVTRFISGRFGTGSIDLTKLCVADLHAFVSRHARNYSARRVQLMLTVLRSFLRFLFLRGEIPSRLDYHVPTAPSWRKTEPPKWLSSDDIEHVLATCDRHSPIGQRDYAILILLARLGLRADEVVSLDLEDIRWETGEISVCGKGRHRKRFPLSDDVGEALAAYLKNVRRRCDSRRIFLRAKAPYRGLGGSSTLDTVVRNALSRAGLDPPLKGAHLFRHSLATKMLRHGATLTEIGQILHHTNPDTTSIYAKVDIDGLRGLALPWPGDYS